MRLCVVDGRGGGLGRCLIQRLVAILGESHELVAAGTNAVSASVMAHEGMRLVGAGDAAVREAVHGADLIVGSLNLVLPGGMLGEVTPEIAAAIVRAPARKLLLPVNRSRIEIVGTEPDSLGSLVELTVARVRKVLEAGAAVSAR